MTVTERLHSAAEKIWNGYHTHPFVTGIAGGTLPAEKFKYFMIQDYLYLFEYARVFAIGVVKAEDGELMRFLAKNTESVLNGEMNIHRRYMSRLGITEDDIREAKAAHANKSYTSYMIAEAERGGGLEILAAVLACFWSYAEIGERIVKNSPNALSHELYGEWVEGYSCGEYQRANAELIAMTDSLCADISERQYGRIEEIFLECSKYEADFWDMAWGMED